MKWTRWIGALVLVVLVVFFATFAMIYLGEVGGGTPPVTNSTAGSSGLQFVTRKVPVDDAVGGPLVHEQAHPGAWDFWFENPTDKPVRLGLNRKNCKCYRVVVFAVPDAYKGQRAAAAGGELLALADPSLASLGVAAGAVQDKELERMRNDAKQLAALEPSSQTESHAEIPPHAAGWVRLEWTGEKPGQQRLQADLWVGQPDSTERFTLEALVNFVPPIKAMDQNLSMGELSLGELKVAPKTDSLVVWSATLPALQLAAETVPPTADGKKDPIVLGTPEPLSPSECRNLEARMPQEGVSVRCAYRVPVTVRPDAEEGNEKLEYGPFKRRVLVKARDDKGKDVGEPIPFLVHGLLAGDIRMGTPEDLGRIDLGSFPKSQGGGPKVGRITTPPGTKLMLDEKRSGDYLQAQLTQTDATTWEVKVKVRPNVAEGDFPREDDEKYRDSAIYVKVLGDDARSLRIPVKGRADN